MATDLFGRPAGAAPDNPEQAARLLHHLGYWKIGQPLPWDREHPSRDPLPAVPLIAKPAPAQPWDALPLDRAA